MRKRIRQTESGFTIVEMLVVVVIFSILLYGVALLLTGLFNNQVYKTRLLDNNDQARKVAANFTNEIRNATRSANGSYPLEIADSQQIAFYTLSGNSIIRVRYYLQAGKLYRATTLPSGNPPVYNLANETATLVQNAIATQAGENIFTYYDGNYNGIGNPLAQPVNVTAPRYVQINLKIFLQGSKNNINSYNVSAGSAIRNLKDNL